MAVTTGHGRRWTGNRASLVAAVLALVMLVPMAVTFLEHWRELDQQREFATGERDGIEYLLTLGELTVAVLDAQSAAVNGQAVARHNLTRALEATSQVDARLGEQYRVAQRWAQLREAITRQADSEFDSPRAAYAGYAEVNDLLLELFTKLRETSGLIRDVDADTYYLQDGAAEELPEAIVAAGRLVDLVSVTALELAAAASAGADPAPPAGQEPPTEPAGQEPSTEPAGQEPPTGPELPEPSEQAALAAALAAVSVARAAVIGPADDLAVDLQAALDSTSSRTLSSNVLNSFDVFLREKDALLAAVPPGADPTQLDLDQLNRHRVGLQAAAIDLFTVLIQEMDALIATRVDERRQQQATVAVAAAVAVLLAIAAAAIGLIGGRRTIQTRPDGVPEAPREASPGAGGALDRAVPAAPPWAEVGRGSDDVVQAELVEWERSGAR